MAVIYSSSDYDREKMAWYWEQGGRASQRLETYSPIQLKNYMTTLSPYPTIVSSLFGDIKLIRQLPVPFHKFSITHDGLVFCQDLLTSRQGQPNEDAFVRSHNILSPKADAEFEMIRLVNLMGGFKSFLVHRLVAAMFLPNPTRMPHVQHNNDITTDNHVQNLQCTSYWPMHNY